MQLAAHTPPERYRPFGAVAHDFYRQRQMTPPGKHNGRRHREILNGDHGIGKSALISASISLACIAIGLSFVFFVSAALPYH